MKSVPKSSKTAHLFLYKKENSFYHKLWYVDATIRYHGEDPDVDAYPKNTLA